MDVFLSALGEEVEDPEEESFLVFSQTIPSALDLGIVDPKIPILDITVAGRDLSIHQSPTVLSSNRKAGTTGAVVWKVTPLFADWLADTKNILFRSSILGTASTVLELGCGVSGIVSVTLAPLVRRYIATDQDYVFKLLKQNIAQNAKQSSVTKAKSSRGGRGKTASTAQTERINTDIEALALDWELDSLSALSEVLTQQTKSGTEDVPPGVDAIVACDCIYNDALIEPFVSTCTDICRLRTVSSSKDAVKPTVCIIAQQLRTAGVFEAWLKRFHRDFRVWRLPERLSSRGLGENSGFVVHVGVLRP
ncbi:hypothetical protein B0A49_03234 [Cryomyces minteri]|uniref:Diaminohydroxyphosphoribosylamino-pyrimidine deaminase n=1 Tax=Cryomyces minteri TaxID=331657 RepID=A0A4U0XID4_9PEZI|nr:hypothetical protein B0A49_03234 [Cryomyces minteri]